MSAQPALNQPRSDGPVPDPDDPMLRVARGHISGRAVALAEHRLVYVPIPKTGWTSMLWALADLAGIPAEAFADSVKPEISTTMAVHDETVWARHRRLVRSLPEPERTAALESPDWARFTVVRDPARRLWSAWQSKFLLREPVYFGFHGHRPWYPHRPADPAEIVADFRAFVAALEKGFATETRLRDPHWGRQSDVVGQLAFTHVGGLEQLSDTERWLAGRLGAPLQLRRENGMPLPFEPALFDEATAARVQRLYGPDYTAFGYQPLTVVPAGPERDEALARWGAAVEPALPGMRELVERHERLYAVVTTFRGRLGAAEERATALEREVRAERERTAQARRQLAKLRASASWRLTAPLRHAKRRVVARARKPGEGPA
jgi:hypothetical protein